MTGQSPLRAWVALVGLSLRRQARARQMVWVALALLIIAAGLVALRTARTGWSSGVRAYRISPRTGEFVTRQSARNSYKPVGELPDRFVRLQDLVRQVRIASIALPAEPLSSALATTLEVSLERTRLYNFTRAIMFSLFIGFLLPAWCLSFATEALGGEREARTLPWLLTRPLPRWSIFLGKYLAIVPWALAFNVGGFWLMCRAAGPPGDEAFRLYWPAIVAGTLAFTSVFHLISAAFRWPTVVGLVYCFFLEVLLGDMPGLLKRVSVSFYVRCLIFDAAAGIGVAPDKPSVYWPVSGSVAAAVLTGITAGALVIGALVFSRAEYRDD